MVPGYLRASLAKYEGGIGPITRASSEYALGANPKTKNTLKVSDICLLQRNLSRQCYHIRNIEKPKKDIADLEPIWNSC